jgi:hypothetical protein
MKTTTASSTTTNILISEILLDISGINKSSKSFFLHVIQLFWCISGHCNFLQFARYGIYCERWYRKAFRRIFPFLSFNLSLVKKNCGSELILAFDPSYIPKSGKKTPGLGYYFSGKAGRALKGIEVGVLACIDVRYQTSIALNITQTIKSKNSKAGWMMRQYISQIVDNAKELLTLSKVIVVDGYFAKYDFNKALVKEGFEIICRLRNDANLKYIYNGKSKGGKGRPRKHSGKVNLENIDKRHFRIFKEDETLTWYASVVYSVCLKINIKVVIGIDKLTGARLIFYSTNLERESCKIIEYYRLRFQIEFLIRDAKQHGGLEHCQSTNAKAINYHLNMSVLSIGIAKIAHWYKISENGTMPFSMHDIKKRYFNIMYIERILSKYDFDHKLKKIIKEDEELLSFGVKAA